MSIDNKRLHVATAAMQSILRASDWRKLNSDSVGWPQEVAKESVRYADALLAELDCKHSKTMSRAWDTECMDCGERLPWPTLGE